MYAVNRQEINPFQSKKVKNADKTSTWSSSDDILIEIIFSMKD